MINLYKINDRKYKSIYISYNFTNVILKEEITYTAVISSLLSNSSDKYKTKLEMERYLANLFGAIFDINIEKYGDLYNLEFRIEVINKKFLPDNADVIKQALIFLKEVIYNPNTESKNNTQFLNKEVESAKEFVDQKLSERKDEKLKYGVLRCEELLCKDSPFSNYIYGDKESLDNINASNLYSHYKNVVNNSCITVIVSGNLDGYEEIEKDIAEVFKEKLDSKKTYLDLEKEMIRQTNVKEAIEVKDDAKTYQSVMSMGFAIKDVKDTDIFALNVYNAILGATPSSKLFQNFREKESLAYTVRSRYYRYKNIIVIYAGIEPKNYSKAKKVILKQLEEITLGNISQEEFDAAKMSMVADLKEWQDSKIAMSKYLLSNLILNKEEEYEIPKFIENIEKVTVEDVIEVSKKLELGVIYFLGGNG